MDNFYEAPSGDQNDGTHGLSGFDSLVGFGRLAQGETLRWRG